MGCILLIDDDIDLRWILTTNLNRAGFEVVTAAEGNEGLRVLKARRIDCILLDLSMPRMDGFAFLTTAVETNRPMPPIYVVSGTDDPQTRQRVVDLGARGLVPKVRACSREFGNELRQLLSKPPTDEVPEPTGLPPLFPT